MIFPVDDDFVPRLKEAVLTGKIARRLFKLSNTRANRRWENLDIDAKRRWYAEARSLIEEIRVKDGG